MVSLLKGLSPRRITTLASIAAFLTVGFLAPRVPLPVFNLLLALLVVPLVWLIWAFARWSAHQHADRYARDVRKIHSGRPRPLPHQEAVSR